MQLMIAAVRMHLLNRSFHLQIVSSSYDIVTTVFLQHENKESATVTHEIILHEATKSNQKDSRAWHACRDFQIFSIFIFLWDQMDRAGR
jgi:hypothetical protein